MMNKLSAGQAKILEMIATGVPIPRILKAIVVLIESQAPDMLASILLLDDDGAHVRHGAASRLPRGYMRLIDGEPIGPRAGSCGTAAYRRRPVIVSDIARDPLWADYRAVAAKYRLAACWSTPIVDPKRRVLGTFALYFRKAGKPSAHHRQAIAVATHTAAIALIRQREERERSRLVQVLGERVKELTVLQDAARLLQGERPADGRLFRQLADLLPNGWQFPAICAARVACGDVEGRTKNWRDSPWRQSVRFKTADQRAGVVEVAYLEERPAAAEGPFLAEERRLLTYVADMLSVYIEHGVARGRLRDREAMFRSIFENAAIGVTMVDLDGRFVTCNPAFSRMVGYTEAELRQTAFASITHPEDVEPNAVLYRSMVSGNVDHFQLEKRYVRKDGGIVWAQLTSSIVPRPGRAPRYSIGMIEDITARKLAEDKVTHLAYFEPLTGLHNRASLQARLAQAVAEAAGGRHSLALLLMNLNNFRDINNTLGHLNGDALLRQVAANLQTTLWGSDMVACLGGDEFAVLLGRLADRSDIDLVLEKILKALGRPIDVGGVPINVEASFGIALYPEHGDGHERLWQRADVALRAAKERQRPFLIYRPDIDHYDPRRLSLLGELGGAIERDELVLHYQPKVDLKSGRVAGVEALVRWQHPAQGLIYPDRFVPLAEHTQLINPLTTWVLASALRQGERWDREGHRLELSVNLSARNLQSAGIGAEIVRMARDAGFPLERLTVEVTETAIMADSALAKKVLTDLHEAGIHISMDDFGIGQSSLSYLKDLPISRMKIDKSFVMGFAEPRNAAIVRSAVTLAHNLDLSVTAEGVEDEATYLALRAMECDLAQGYYVARPMPVDKIPGWLDASQWAKAPAA